MQEGPSAVGTERMSLILCIRLWLANYLQVLYKWYSPLQLSDSHNRTLLMLLLAIEEVAQTFVFSDKFLCYKAGDHN